MKYLGLLISCILCFHAEAQYAGYSLNSGASVEWKVYPVAQASGTEAAISSSGYNTSAWIPAQVPGTFFVDYVNAGLEARPEYGDNIYRVDESKYNQPFWYRTEFEIPASFTQEKIYLNFEGINKKATVYLNGAQLGIIKGHVQRAKYDVSAIVRHTGKNILLVRIDIPKQRHDRHPQGFDSFANYAMPSYMASASWDWMPYVPGLNCGITNDVYLSNSGAITLEDTWIRTGLPDKTTAHICLQTQVKNTDNQVISGKLIGTVQPGNIQFEKEISIAAQSEQTLIINQDEFSQLTIQNPQLWWPNGYGEPNLYVCRLKFEINSAVSDEKEIRFGIRKYEYKTENTALTFYINGEKILLRGGNWGMSEYLLRCRGEEYETKVKLHADMNFNTIRLWTGCVTDEEFYDYCDRYGIMVWDDFWLASAIGGPDDTNEFRSNAVDKVKRLRNHPCIALWCGANESEPPGALDNDLKNIVAEHDGNDRRYQSNSRKGGGLTGSGFWNNFPARDYFGEGIPSWGGDFGDWNKKYGLRTELGIATFTTFESFREFMPEADWWPSDFTKNAMWNNHFFGQSASAANPDSYFNAVKTNYGVSPGIETFCEKAQYLNLELGKAIYEAWNDHLWNDATGIILWMSNPAYPSFVWQTYDYYYDATGVYWGAKKACEPLHIQWNCATNSVKVINTTLQNYTGLKAKATVYNLDGSIYEPLSMEKTVNVSPKNLHECFTLVEESGRSQALSDLNFIRLELRDSNNQLLSGNFYWRNVKNADNYTALNSLPEADLTTSALPRRENGQYIIDYTVTNQSATVAFGIRLRVVNARNGQRILPVFMPENYFTLMPGETKQIPVTFDESLIGNDEAAVLLKQYGFAEEENPGETAVSQIKSQSKWHFYPNPATETVYLDAGKESFALRIFDLNGKTVYKGQNEPDIHIGHLSKGFYLLQITAGNEIMTTKLIKQ